MQNDFLSNEFDDTRRLEVSISTADGVAEFCWRKGSKEEANGTVRADKTKTSIYHGVSWVVSKKPKPKETGSTFDSASIHAALRVWLKLYPVLENCVMLSVDGTLIPLGKKPFTDLGTAIFQAMKPFKPTAQQRRAVWDQFFAKPQPPPPALLWCLRVVTDMLSHEVRIEWIHVRTKEIGIVLTIQVSDYDELTWTSVATKPAPGQDAKQVSVTTIEKADIFQFTERWLRVNPLDLRRVELRNITSSGDFAETYAGQGIPADAEFIGENIFEMGYALSPKFGGFGGAEIKARQRERARQEELAERIAATAKEREQREAEKEAARQSALARIKAAELERELKAAPAPVAVLHEAAMRVELPPFTFQDSALPLASLARFLLLERATQWWVSNQTDDLLCLPTCRIERLEYQVRTALRVLGPLRGRALLSDEVGLGKTIEAGLVCKELLTRGMARRLLILTMPSLVDQWAEEMRDKFGIESVTTNQPLAKSSPERFWRENNIIIASLHTAKQAAHLAIARTIEWDALVVDEAHHLRNRDSLAWQAVNALPRQFLLLLSATPVQNSIEELYNLVTLLQPGQLPTPKEFRARFIDPEKPRQPREPEELRRLLGQVMIRNTRANAGIKLPSRHAETALFEPTEEEEKWRIEWEADFRTKLAALPASQTSLWGRLLLQAAGSSPAAWRSALEKFPDKKAAAGWSKTAPLETSWKRKCALLPPLAKGDGGCVIFSQFLDTQAALATFLRSEGVKTFVINGSTPAAERQPITEQFRAEGGALLLSSSGAEGRNLQFCHRLINFDLPWNPMEIEQRIGRLHRLGQTRVVRIYNIVQRGTLQEHLLDVLQEKLNLFELVVGETGMVLGEKFSSDEFAEEVLQRWRGAESDVAGAFQSLGEELAAARAAYGEVQRLDATLFAQDYDTE